jgi:hypothetical protein
VGRVENQSSARVGNYDMLGTNFTVSQILLSFLCSLIAIDLVMTITKDANASERPFGVGYSRLSTADPMGGQMQYSLWYPTEYRMALFA